MVHCEYPEVWQVFKAFSSTRPGASELAKDIHLPFNFPFATARHPFLTHAFTLHGAFFPFCSQALIAPFFATSREGAFMASAEIPVLRLIAHAPYLEGTSILTTLGWF